METEPLLQYSVEPVLREAEESVHNHGKSEASNFGQLMLLMLVMLCEPITAFMPVPFLVKLVTESGITNGDSSMIGFYVGLIESVFFIAQGCCILQWGRLSDRIGRRPVILVGLFGLGASMVSFGLSRSFTGVVLSRVIAGVLNGNVGVAKTMVAELSNDSNRARVISFLPITWIAGATITPIIGGALQHPAERFPIFYGNAFLEKYPYFLPCSVSAGSSALAWLVCFFFMKETLIRKAPTKPKTYGTVAPGSSTPRLDVEQASISSSNSGQPTSIRDVLTRPVLISVLNYAWIAILDIANFAILTVFLPVPSSAGGLGLSPPVVGIVLGFLGLVNGTLQFIFFPSAYKRWGPRTLVIASIAAYYVIYACIPGLKEMADRSPHVEPGKLHLNVWILMAFFIFISAMIDVGYSVIFSYISSSVPSTNLLGTANGVSQTVISFVRALGPVGATSLFSISAEHHEILHGYAVFVFLMILTTVAVYSAMLLPEKEWTHGKVEGDENDEE